MKTLRFVPATQEDIPVILEQCKALIDRYEDKKLIDYEKVLGWMERKITSNIAQYTCVLTTGEKAAYYCLDQREEETELDDLYVLPPFQNQGIGSAIIEKCINVTEKPLMLYVFTGNERAISLYRRYGFMVVQQVSPTRCIMMRRT